MGVDLVYVDKPERNEIDKCVNKMNYRKEKERFPHVMVKDTFIKIFEQEKIK